MKCTEISYQEIFGDILGTHGITSDQINKPNVFSQINENVTFCVKIKLIEPQKEKRFIVNPVPLLNMNKVLLIKMTSYQKQTYCLGKRHMSNTIGIIEYEKLNPKTQKLVKIVKGVCSLYGRKKSQIFTK